MAYPTVSWLVDADLILVELTAKNDVITSLGLKTELRSRLPGVSIRQKEVSDYLAQAWKDNKFPHTYGRNFTKTTSYAYATYSPLPLPVDGEDKDEEYLEDD